MIKIKNLLVEAVWQSKNFSLFACSSFFFVFLLSYSFHVVQAKDCHKVTSLIELEDKVFTKNLLKILAQLREKKTNALLAYFHPRLKIKEKKLKEIFSFIDEKLKKPLNISLLDLWQVNTSSSKTSAYHCQDGVKIYAHYGYDQQFFWQLKLAGKKEAGELLISFVPYQKKYKIAYLDFIQTSLEGKKWDFWLEKALQTEAKKQEVLSYFYFDLAAKLLTGNSYLEYQDKQVIEEKLRERKLKERVQQKLAELLKEEKILHFSSLFSHKGLALLLRLQLKKELSGVAIRENCFKIRDQLQQEKWMQELAGVRCSYVLPHENPKREGQQGSIFIGLNEIEKDYFSSFL